jgi:hypothetical protein
VPIPSPISGTQQSASQVFLDVIIAQLFPDTPTQTKNLIRMAVSYESISIERNTP